MRIAFLIAVGLLLVVFVLTTFTDSPKAIRKAQSEGFTPDFIEQGRIRSLQRSLIGWSATFVVVGFYGWLVLSGAARKLTDRIETWTKGRWFLTVAAIAACCFLVERILLFPIAVWSLENLRAWGLTNRPFLDWLSDYGKLFLLNLTLWTLLPLALYALMRWFPRRWWLVAATGSVLLGIGFAYILPIWIEPLFNTFQSLEETHPQLAERIRELTQHAGIPVEGVYVKDASRQALFTNAYFTGFGDTRRIVLYDTLIERHPPEEVLSIVAHEIGHWKHQHIVVGIGLAAIGGFVGFWLLAVILKRVVGRPPLRLRTVDDPAGWPFIILLMLLATWAVRPVENAISRTFERQADLYALDMTRSPAAFISAEKRLARDNKMNVAPNPWAVWFFGTHPPVVERIEMARHWAKQYDD